MVAKKRLGVGAAPSSAAAAVENVSEDWTKSIKKQILSVGKKRRHDNLYGEDDDDNNAADSTHDNSSSDEEEGRTTAVKERKKKKKTVPVVSTDASSIAVGDVTTNDDTKSKKKKKKGKKERAQEKQAAQDAESTKEGETAAQSSTTPSAASDKEQTTEEVVTNITECKKPNQKRKRPKVRSRQKNIAKDNRKANDKPSHLVLGRDDYAGRPMTQRTREKLGLGKSKSSMKSKKSVKLDNAFDKGEWVDEDGLKEEGKSESKVDATSSSGPGGDGDDAKSSTDNDVGESVEKPLESSLKKIGDCIVDYEPSSSSITKKKKKKDKKKKKKYKNV